jgi:hypothetical protein
MTKYHPTGRRVRPARPASIGLLRVPGKPKLPEVARIVDTNGFRPLLGAARAALPPGKHCSGATRTRAPRRVLKAVPAHPPLVGEGRDRLPMRWGSLRNFSPGNARWVKIVGGKGMPYPPCQAAGRFCRPSATHGLGQRVGGACDRTWRPTTGLMSLT